MKTHSWCHTIVAAPALLAVALLLAGAGARAAAAEPVQLLNVTSSVWRYHTNKFDPGYTPADAWVAPGFNDTSWPSGRGTFGFESTAGIYPAFNTYITPPNAGGGVSSYFRTHFTWTNSTVTGVTLVATSYLDDGMIVWLNGVEISAFNMPANRPVAWNDSTLPGGALAEPAVFQMSVPATGLLQGDNVLAVQLQQSTTTSSDNVWGMNLWGVSSVVTDGWVRLYDSPGTRDDAADNVAVDGSGNVIVSGHSTTVGFWDYTNMDRYTAKYAAASGALLWERIANGVFPSYPGGMVLDSHGDVVVAGIAYSGTTTGQCYMAKYAAADGAVIWERHLSDPMTYPFYSSPTLALDGGGNVLLTMSLYGGDPAVGGTGADYYTAKCAAADGAILWEKRYNGPGNSDDNPTAVAADTNGNVVVMGTTAILKYAAADGALLWEHRYSGATKGKFPTVAMALDGNGNVIGVGSIEFSDPIYGNSTFDMYTAKYSGTNGTLLWEKRFNGPYNSLDQGRAVAVDRLGNVVVAGNTTADLNGDGPKNVIYTAKYAGTNGALLWEQMYNNNYNLHRGGGSPFAVAVDRADNAVVTGYVEGLQSMDFYTAKYAGANGVLLWQKRYNGPASGNDIPYCLALGPNGTVVVAGSSVNGSGNTDFATVVYWETLPPVSIALVPEGTRIRFTGVAARTYKIQRAPAVTGPWSTLATPTAPSNGLIEYLDTSALAAPAFYRATTP